MDRVIQGAGASRPGWARLPGLGPSSTFSPPPASWPGPSSWGRPSSTCPARLLGGRPSSTSGRPPGAWPWPRALLVWVALLAVRSAPLGLLAVLALPDREGRLARLFRVALPAIVVALALALLALAARAGWTRPGPFELVLPAVGILLGVWAGLAWRRGWWSRLVFLPKLAVLAARCCSSAACPRRGGAGAGAGRPRAATAHVGREAPPGGPLPRQGPAEGPAG